ncbi:MAG: holdfast anchoring protein HfaA [Pseudomonadota bacterium]
MTLPKAFLIATAAAGLSTAAHAGDWTNSANYNGFGNTTQNAPSNFSLRDANGNLTVVNGQFVGSSYSTSTGAQSASAYGSGVGMAGSQPMSGQATAIGNSLNVVVVGNHNTTVVDSSQINSGNQTATAQLSGR